MIAEEVLPHVILALFLLIFYLAYLAMKDEANEMERTKEGRPINRSAAVFLRLEIYSLLCAAYSHVLFLVSLGASLQGEAPEVPGAVGKLKRRNKGKKD